MWPIKLKIHRWLISAAILIFPLCRVTLAIEKGEDASWLGVPELKGKVSLVVLTNPYAPQFRSFVQSFDPAPFQQNGRQMFMVVDQGMSSNMPSMSAVLKSKLRETAGIGNAAFEHHIQAYPAYLVIDPQGKVFNVRVGNVNTNDLIHDMASVPAPPLEKIVYEMGETTLRFEYLELPSASDPATMDSEETGSLVLSIPKFIESLYVDARGSIAKSLCILEAGKHYSVGATGSVTLGAAVAGKYIVADAGFVFQADKGTYWGDFSLPAPSGTLAINGQGITPREAYNPGHEYTQDVDGTGAPGEFKILDSEYADNGGRLLVRIERLFGYQMAVFLNTSSQSVLNDVQEMALSGKLQEAIDLLEKALQTSNDSTFWNSLGVLYLKLSEPQKTEGLAMVQTDPLGRALTTLERALSSNGSSASIYNNLGVAHRKAGDSALARENFKKALSLEKDFRPAAMNLALLDEENKMKPSVGSIASSPISSSASNGKK